MNIVIAILALGLLVVFHEFGHFIVAKANGVRVKEFAIGFGPKIFGFKKGETEYTFNILPFGGACIMQGDMEDTAKDEVIDEDRSFGSKSVWARIAIIAAGPIFNFFLAFIFSVIIISNVGYQPAKVYDVEEGTPAYEAGLRAGDEILKINGRSIGFASEYDVYTMVYPDKTYNITYKRDGKKYKTSFTPVKTHQVAYRIGIMIQNASPVKVVEVSKDSVADKAGVKAGDGVVSINGVSIETADQVSEEFTKAEGAECTVVIMRDGSEMPLKITPDKVEYDEMVTGMYVFSAFVKGSPVEVVTKSASQVRYDIMTVIDSLRMLVSGKVKSDDVAGPVGIVNIISDTVNESKTDGIKYMLLNLMYLVALLSANLGVMNLLPIPALDGGRLVFLFIEAIRRKPVDREKEGIIHLVGMACLMVLMVFILFNDIKNVFFK